MADSAKVTSIEVLENFRANLIVYIGKAIRVLDDVSGDIQRTKTWLQNDRITHWKTEIRKRNRMLDQANAELMTARLGDNRESIQARKLAYNQARALVKEAEDRLAVVKHWLRNYESAVESKTKLVHQMRHLLDYEMKQAVAFLSGAGQSLAAYAEVKAPASAPDSSGTSSDDGGAE